MPSTSDADEADLKHHQALESQVADFDWCSAPAIVDVTMPHRTCLMGLLITLILSPHFFVDAARA